MATTRNDGPWARAWRQLRRRRAAMAGLVVVLGFIALALLAPWLSPHDPIATSWSAIRKPPSAEHWFGTDDIGRDVLSRVVWGTRASLLAGVVSVSIALLAGVPIGMLAGFVGGGVDALISRITDVTHDVPRQKWIGSGSGDHVVKCLGVNTVAVPRCRS